MASDWSLLLAATTGPRLTSHANGACEMSFTNEELLAFFEEQLPAERMAEIELASRSDDQLQQRLARAASQLDPGNHSVGAIWRRRRLSCLSRAQLGGYLLGALADELVDFVEFHLNVTGCRFCQANLEDLREASEAARATTDVQQRRKKYFQSSAGYLSPGGD